MLTNDETRTFCPVVGKRRFFRAPSGNLILEGKAMKKKDYIPLTQAGRGIPGTPSIPTLWRWSTRGCSGVVLQTRKFGGRRFTKREWIAQFNDEVNAADRLTNQSPAETALAGDGI